MEDKKVKVTILGHEFALQDGVGQVGDAVDWAQKYIKDAIKDVPYAPAVMAGISARQTLEDYSVLVRLVTFSHDFKLLVSALIDSTVRIWDPGNGQCLQTLGGHSDPVLVALSHDSKLLASALFDGTVRVWDAGSG